MGTFNGTTGTDTIIPGTVSPGVTANTAGSKPSGAADAIDGIGGTDTIDGGGGADTISFSGAGSVGDGGAGNDTITFRVPAGSGPVSATANGGAGSDVVAFDVAYGGGSASYSGSMSLRGGEGSDTIRGNAAFSFDTSFQNVDVSLYGDRGNDRIEATTQDTGSSFIPVEGAKNNDFLYGGTGNDTFYVQEQQDVAIENPGEGTDTVVVNNSSTDSYTLAPNVEKLVVRDWYYHISASLTGNATANEITGTWKADTLDGAGGNDSIYGKPVSETYVGEDDHDTLRGGAGNDLIYGAGGPTDTWDGNDSLYGNEGNDSLYGQQGNDRLYGQQGNDRLYGDLGADTLAGGESRDRLYGGDGSDRFDYDSVGESLPGASNRDVIYDFSGIGGGTVSEQIDLSTIDATAGGGEDAFTFIGTAAFTAPGQLRVRDSSANGDTLIQANTAGPSGAELEIVVADGATAAATDWVAEDFVL